MSKKDYYTRDERRAYKPPPCPHCGQPQLQHWMDDSDGSSTEKKFRPGTYECTNPRCPGLDAN